MHPFSGAISYSEWYPQTNATILGKSPFTTVSATAVPERGLGPAAVWPRWGDVSMTSVPGRRCCASPQAWALTPPGRGDSHRPRLSKPVGRRARKEEARPAATRCKNESTNAIVVTGFDSWLHLTVKRNPVMAQALIGVSPEKEFGVVRAFQVPEKRPTLNILYILLSHTSHGYKCDQNASLWVLAFWSLMFGRLLSC